jgi:hypothetical protein
MFQLKFAVITPALRAHLSVRPAATAGDGRRMGNHRTRSRTAQKPQNTQNTAGFLCGFREFCVDRRGWRVNPGTRAPPARHRRTSHVDE